MEKVKFFLQLVQTTSPSHVMLASLDASRYMMDKYGYTLLSECIQYSNRVRNEINKNTKFYCLSYEKKGEDGVFDVDPTRLAVNVIKGGLKGSDADKILREKYKVQVELSDINNIVAITTVGDGKEEYGRFLRAIYGLSEGTKGKGMLDDYKEIPRRLPKVVIFPYEAIYRDTALIDITKSNGMISAEMAIPYPPGIPVIMPGEVIDGDIIDFLKQCKDAGIRISGTTDPNLEKIKIIK